MIRTLLIFCFFLWGQLVLAQIFPVEQIMDNGPEAQRINFVILGDGYTASQQDDFNNDAIDINNQVFNKTPFKEYAPFFNAFIIKVPSNESGASHPGTATDVGEPAHPVSHVDNFFGSTFDYFNIHRLLVPTNSGNVYNVVANNYPGYDQVIVLVNSPYYGGSGGALATTSLESAAPEIAIHELGHSFAGLADEYWAGDVYANEKPNMTANSDPVTVKWSNWVGNSGVNVYPYGSSGNQANWYRPHQNCEMRFLNKQFCAVCRETFIDKIYTLTDPIDDFSPTEGVITYQGNPINFSADLVLPSPNTLKVKWLINGTVIESGVENIVIEGGDIPLTNNTVELQVIDTTLLSRSYLPASGYTFSINWTVKNTPLPVELIDFTATDRISQVDLEWKVAREVNIDHYELERSANGTNFYTIEAISARGNDQQLHIYQSSDYYPLSGKSYYRLKIIEEDGSFEYSPVAAINRVQKFFYKLFPNPVHETLFLQYFINDFSPEMKLEILNNSGQLLFSQGLPGSKGDHHIQVDLATYPAGVYFVRLQKGDYLEEIQFIKE